MLSELSYRKISKAPRIVFFVRRELLMREIASNMDLVDIPTLHLHGLTDVNLENGRKQVANYYNPRMTRVIEINYHHAMPWHKHDLLKLEEAIRKIDKETEDRYELVP
jgi:hypothetical protein